ncbi:hypothetical protein Golax_001189 [Gossypium laxum]|uniref:DUF4283 domain-containing protein n=1 Tax=Gossypium laxum TaxID=34288 RepID=A0A7J9AW16_9ROSI|nr:hypothetical protein [Gossypium laxum]
MEAELANLNLKDKDEESFQFDKDRDRTKEDYLFCLVRKALTDCVVHFPSLKITLADLWHPLRGVLITDIWEKRYLLCFFYEVDIKWVLGGSKEGGNPLGMDVDKRSKGKSFDANKTVNSYQNRWVEMELWLNRENGDRQTKSNYEDSPIKQCDGKKRQRT